MMMYVGSTYNHATIMYNIIQKYAKRYQVVFSFLFLFFLIPISWIIRMHLLQSRIENWWNEMILYYKLYSPEGLSINSVGT